MGLLSGTKQGAENAADDHGRPWVGGDGAGAGLAADEAIDEEADGGSDGDADEAVGWYARGYYYEAKRKGLLEETGLRT